MLEEVGKGADDSLK